MFAACCGGATALAQSEVWNEAAGQKQNYVLHIELVVNAQCIIVSTEVITSLIVMDPQFVKAELTGPATVTIRGLAVGETIVILLGKNLRHTYAVGVKSRAADTPEQIAARARRLQTGKVIAGSYSISFSPGFGQDPSFLRQSFDYRRKLSGDRTLRLEGNFFKFFGQDDRRLTYSTEPGFGLDRVSIGLDSAWGKLDLLDSELNLSPLSLNAYSMRGVHLVSSPNSRLRGVELFGGLARPYLNLFGTSEGYLGGLILPVAQGKSWKLRAGLLVIAPRGHSGDQEKGLVWHADGRYSPDENTSAEAELAFAKGAISWRGRLDLQRGPVSIYGESSRLDRRSPLTSIGAQSGGRKMDVLRIGWQPNARFTASVGYNRAAAELPRSQGGTLGNSTWFGNADFNLTRESRLGLRFTRQKIESAQSNLSTALQSQTSSLAVTHSVRFAQRWSNDSEISLMSSRELRESMPIDHGLSFRNELRRSWDRWTATGYVYHASSATSIAGLLLSNPQLLPPPLRESFQADPVRFIVVNRDVLRSLLAGIELPATRGTDVGIRWQGLFSRYTFSGDVRFSSSEILAQQRRDLVVSFGASVRLDAANSLQISGSRPLTSSASGAPPALTFSYTHRFGIPSSEGFQFSRLFGLDRGRVHGRVFFDLNANGQDDVNEPGIPGMKIQLDGNKSLTSDETGHFNLSSISPGEHSVVLISKDFGVSIRASTATEQQVFLSPRQTIKIAFGITNSGFVSGRIFNDLYLKGEEETANLPGVRDVAVSLRPAAASSGTQVLRVTVDSSGSYEFRNLVPGNYTLEMDPITFPADFRLPAQTSWTVPVEPLRGSYVYIPLAAERAISGIVFRDKDNDGQFDPKNDEVTAGARVLVHGAETVSDRNGSYILRNLPSGATTIRAQLSSGDQSAVITVILLPEPDIRRGVNLIIPGSQTAASAKQ